MSIIVDRALQIDVEIQIELEEIEEGSAQRSDTGLLNFDPFDTLVGQESSSDGEDDEDEDPGSFSDISSEEEEGDVLAPVEHDLAKRAKHVKDMVVKLDHILKLLFDHFEKILEESDDANPELRQSRIQPYFVSLLGIFERSILKTFKSRYTQFLLFWFTSKDPSHADVFQGFLLSRALLEADQPSVTRCAAASYLSSFVSRALFVDTEGARKVVALLCEYLEGQLNAFDEAGGLDGLLGSAEDGVQKNAASLYSVFYAVCQAVFLIFCFRWRELLDDEEGDEDAMTRSRKKWLPELRVVQRLILSSLNPLKVRRFLINLSSILICVL